MMKSNNIPIHNIYYMLAYAFKTLDTLEYSKINPESFENIHNMFASILSNGIKQQIKRGLYKEYVTKDENITKVRGKILIGETIHYYSSRKREVQCEYDYLSENNILNQILKTTVFLLMNHKDVNKSYKDELKKEMLFFSEIDFINPKIIKWKSMKYTKSNSTYKMLLTICEFILNNMLLSDKKGDYHLASFIDDQKLSRLYEKFMLEYYKKNYPELKPRSSRIPWALDDDKNEMLPAMQSDITLENQNNILIIDAKYYSQNLQSYYDTKSIISSNLYQIFTYVKNMSLLRSNKNKQVSGMLLYAKTTSSIQPNVSYLMSGNRIKVKNLNLDLDFKLLTKQLDDIAENILCSSPTIYGLLERP